MARKYRRPLGRSPKSDPQRGLIYRMENEALGATCYASLTRAAVGRLIRSLCRNYKTTPVSVRYADLGHSHGAEWEAPNIITLNVSSKISRDLLTVTHEFAHHLHENIAPANTHEVHGPEFMACHVSVLDRVRYIPVVGMRAVLKSYGIRFHDPGSRQSLATLRKAVLQPASQSRRPRKETCRAS